MSKHTHPRSNVGLDYLGLENNDNAIWNLTPPELYEEAIQNGEAVLTKDYALRVLTGKYTGRSPKDKFIVDQPSIHDDIDWGEINQPTDEDVFGNLFEQVTDYLQDKKIYVKDCYAGADEKYQLNVRVVSEAAYHGLFSHNMFIRPTNEQLKNHEPEFTVLAAPNFKAVFTICPLPLRSSKTGNFICIFLSKTCIFLYKDLKSRVWFRAFPE